VDVCACVRKERERMKRKRKEWNEVGLIEKGNRMIKRREDDEENETEIETEEIGFLPYCFKEEKFVR